jgi:4-hydroxy-2-oxoheptanedioate aldolase
VRDEVHNKIKSALAEGKLVVNGWLTVPHAFVAEMMAQAGWDSLTVDMQHGMQDYAGVLACFQGMQVHGITPVVRVPWNEPGIIGKVLDAGAQAVICPMINSRREAESFVSYCRYPPDGVRSFGPLRASMFTQPGPTMMSTANREILCIPQIETRAALECLHDILDVPGIDGVYIGPADLGISLGYGPKTDRDEPQLLKIFDEILAAAKKRGKFAVFHCATGNAAREAASKGFQFITVGMDMFLMLSAAKAAVALTRSNE